MALENLYFRHEFNSRNDPKLIKIKRRLGYEGIGIYWSLVEVLYERNGLIKNDELEDICWGEQIPYEKALEIIKLGDFKKDRSGNYYLAGVLERIKKREEYSQMQSKKANKRWANVKKKVDEPEWMKRDKKEEEEIIKNNEFTEEEKKEAEALKDKLLKLN